MGGGRAWLYGRRAGSRFLFFFFIFFFRFLYYYIYYRYEFQEVRGSGNMPHVHSLYSIDDSEDKQAIFNKIKAMDSMFYWDNETFSVEECRKHGNICLI